MLKYQVRNTKSTCTMSTQVYGGSSSSPSSSLASCSLLDVTLLPSRSNSMMSLTSTDSNASENDVGILRIDTSSIKQCTDYKTLRVSAQTTARVVIEQVLQKFKLTCKDVNLYQLFMEVTTRAEGRTVRTYLALEDDARPLELQKCHPAGMSRFVLHMTSSGSLVRVHDHNISPQSNYKSLMLARHTTCEDAIQLVLAMNRKTPRSDVNYGLFLTSPDAEAQIPEDISLVSVAQLCKPDHKIVIRMIENF